MKIKSKLLAWASLPISLMCSGAGLAHGAGSARFAPELEYGPFVYRASDGQIRGLSIDLLNELRPALGFTIEMQEPQPLAHILEAAQRGEVDLISSVRLTADRTQYLEFTSPYVEVPAVLVSRRHARPTRLSQLAGQTVAVGRGYAAEDFLRTAYPAVRWQAVQDDQAALRGVLRGDFQAAVADIASVTFLLREHRLQGLQVGDAVGFSYPLSFAYRKEMKEFGQRLQSALESMTLQRRQQIVNRWIDSTTMQFEDPRRVWLRWLGLTLGAGAAVVLLVDRWRRRGAPQP